MCKFSSIVLAAGLGKRMKSDIPKVMHRLLGVPMVEYEIRMLESTGIVDNILVVGHKKEELENHFKNRVKYAIQSEQLGTGHAVKCVFQQSLPLMENVLVICGDTPLLKKDTIESAVAKFLETSYDAAVLTVELDDPFGYGRILRQGSSVTEIVEQKDADKLIQSIREVNTGIYLFRTEVLNRALESIQNDNVQSEYYLTDVVRIINSEPGKTVKAFKYDEPIQFSGINNRYQLARAEEEMLTQHLKELMESGVRILRPDTVYIEKDVCIEPDVLIYPGTIIKNGTKIGSGSVINGGCLSATVIGRNVLIRDSYIIDSEIQAESNIGPFVDMISNKVSKG